MADAELLAVPVAPPDVDELAVLSWLLDLGRSVLRNPSKSLLGLGDPLVAEATEGDIERPMAAGAVFLFSNLGFSLGGSREVGEEGQEVFRSSLEPPGMPPSPPGTPCTPGGAGMDLHLRPPPDAAKSLSLKFVCEEEESAPWA